jgi:hypothetical protein
VASRFNGRISGQRGIPLGYEPKKTEIVLARRTASDPYTRAVVIAIDPRRHGKIMYSVIWLDDNPDTTTPIVKNTRGWVYAWRWPPMIREIEDGQRGAPTV